jgi:hypothetical protein
VTLGYDRMVVGFIKGLLGSSSYGSRIHKGTVGVVVMLVWQLDL